LLACGFLDGQEKDIRQGIRGNSGY
jgi:hypothetical protein